MGTSYVSNKPVPAGTPLSDTNYWAVYGASSGAIIHLQDQIDDINNTKIPPLQASATKFETENDVSRVVVFADSYGRPNGGVTPFTDDLTTRFAAVGVEYEYYATGSVGICPNTAVPDGLSTYIDDHWYSSITTPETVSHVVIVMGANDIAVNSSLPTYFPTLCANLKTKFPNANIIFAFVGTTHAQTVGARKATYKYYKELSNLYGCYYLDGSEYIMCDCYNLQSDYVHPNATGAQYLSDMVFGSLTTHVYHYLAYHQGHIESADITGDIGYNVTFDDNAIIFQLNGSDGFGAKNFTTTLVECTYRSGEIPFRGDGTAIISVAVKDANNNGSTLKGVFQNKMFYIGSLYQTDNLGAFKAIGNTILPTLNMG